MSKTEDNDNISRHKKFIEHSSVRQILYEQFAPTFFFHSSENNFPVDPCATIQNIIEVKRDEYVHIQERHHRALTKSEQEELDAINRFFWKENRFNPNYRDFQHDPDFIKLTAREEGAPVPTFLIFDEKHYGYKVGEKIDVVGVAPEGHKNYNKNKQQAPIATSIIPTSDGFFIQYQYAYALNNAIVGTQWLRNILPESWCKKVEDFGFHYGDCEGVGIHVKVDDKGQASFNSLQTFAHGRKGARNVPAEKCTFDENGKVCVFVGSGGHPSYADNFVGRNQFVDLVGTAYKINPTTFIDVSPDVLTIALDLTREQPNPDHKNHKLLEAAKNIPPSLSAFTKFADSNPLAYHGEKTLEEVDGLSKTHNNYQPFLIFTNLWNLIFNKILTKQGMNKSVDMNALVAGMKEKLPVKTQDDLSPLPSPSASKNTESEGHRHKSRTNSLKYSLTVGHFKEEMKVTGSHLEDSEKKNIFSSDS